ncbi:MAG TPA: extracellular solute-binding protein, partial [Chloroflexota bacterium]|nr:extracellular solute-binding protein [Chloroflexota bacterium]
MTQHRVQGPSRRQWLFRGLIAGALWLSGCGTGAAPAAPAATTAPAAAPKPAATTAPAAAAAAAAPAEDLAALYTAAKAEGELNFYTTLNTNNGQPIIEKFMAKYPGLKVNYNRQTSEKLEEIMNQEAKAGKLTWDVVECNEDVFVRLVTNNFIQPYSPSVASKYPANLRDPKGSWVTDRVNPQTPSLNTNLVKPDQYPKVWDDLTTPAWKGKM